MRLLIVAKNVAGKGMQEIGHDDSQPCEKWPRTQVGNKTVNGKNVVPYDPQSLNTNLSSQKRLILSNNAEHKMRVF